MKRTYTKEWLEQFIYDNGSDVEEIVKTLPNLTIKQAYDIIYGKTIKQLDGHLVDKKYTTNEEYKEYHSIDDNYRDVIEYQYIDYTSTPYYQQKIDKLKIDNRGLNYEDHLHDVFLKKMITQSNFLDNKIISTSIRNSQIDETIKNKRIEYKNHIPESSYTTNEAEYNLLLNDLITKYKNSK